MLYPAIRTRVIERLAEYHAGAAEAAADASYSGQTIYNRIIEQVRKMVGEIAEKDPEKVATTTTMTYTADAESVALPAAAARTRILTVEQLVGLNYYPMPRVTLGEEQAARIGQTLRADYRFRVEGANIIIWPKPAAALPLRIRYVPRTADIIDVTNDADAPDAIPEEFHGLIAMRTAASFKAETSSVPFAEEMAYDMARFLRWAASADNEGPRMVRIVDDY